MDNRQSSKRMLRLGVAMLWALLALPFQAFAGIPEGTAWLSTQQNADHSFGNTPASLATPIQSTAEVLCAFAAFGQQGQPAFANALGYLNGDAESNTEFLVRKIVVNAAAGNDVAALIAALTGNQDTGKGDGFIFQMRGNLGLGDFGQI